MNTLKFPKPIDALCDSIQTEDLSNALAELMPFSVSSSKFYVWAPETDRDDGMVKAQNCTTICLMTSRTTDNKERMIVNEQAELHDTIHALG